MLKILPEFFVLIRNESLTFQNHRFVLFMHVMWIRFVPVLVQMFFQVPRLFKVLFTVVVPGTHILVIIGIFIHIFVDYGIFFAVIFDVFAEHGFVAVTFPTNVTKEPLCKESQNISFSYAVNDR